MSKKTPKNHHYSHIPSYFHNNKQKIYHSPPILYWKYRLLNLPPVARQIWEADAIMKTPIHSSHLVSNRIQQTKRFHHDCCKIG
jgi:hypothetical protein